MKNLKGALDKLASDFAGLDLTFHPFNENGVAYRKSFFPGKDDEVLVVCAYRGSTIHEPFHRQDFFFLNYAYRGDFGALSGTPDRITRVKEGDIYISQPFGGYGLESFPGEEALIIGLLIRKEAFFKHFLETFAEAPGLFKFYLDPQRDPFSDEFLHMHLPSASPVKSILETMTVLYTFERETSQPALINLAQAVFRLVTTAWGASGKKLPEDAPAAKILSYIDAHAETASLKSLSREFGYHPAYISALIHQETGKTFSETVLDKRMEKALILMRGTDLPLEDIALRLGYSSTSNFYKAFRTRFGESPRAYALQKSDSGRTY